MDTQKLEGTLNIIFMFQKIANHIIAFIQKFFRKNREMIINRRDKIEEKYPLREMWKDAKTIDVAAVSCVSYLEREHPEFEEALRNGTKFRIITMNPKTITFDEHFTYKLQEGTYLSSSVDSISKLDELSKKYQGTLETKTTDIDLPYSIMIVNKKSGEAFVKVDLYAVGIAAKYRPSAIINKRLEYDERDDIEFDKDKFCFFQKQFDYIWDNQIKLDGNLKTTKKEKLTSNKNL